MGLYEEKRKIRNCGGGGRSKGEDRNDRGIGR